MPSSPSRPHHAPRSPEYTHLRPSRPRPVRRYPEYTRLRPTSVNLSPSEKWVSSGDIW